MDFRPCCLRKFIFHSERKCARKRINVTAVFCKNGLLHRSSITSFVQGLLTSGYIILLSRVGERVAADMRKTLFAALLRYAFPNVGAKECMDTVKAAVTRQDAVIVLL